MYKAPQVPQMAELTFSGTPAAQNYTYTFVINQQTQNFLSISSSTDIDLPSGHYYAIAYPDYTRASTSANNAMYWHLNGTQGGKIGGSDHYTSKSTDNPEITFTLTSSGVLTLRQTAWSGSAITLTPNCRAIIMRVPL